MAQGGVRCRGSGEGQKARWRAEPSRAGLPGDGELVEVADGRAGGVFGGCSWLFAFALLAFAAGPDAVC